MPEGTLVAIECLSCNSDDDIVVKYVCVLWLQRKNDEDKKNRADDMKFIHNRQIPVKQVMLHSDVLLEYDIITPYRNFYMH